MEKKEREYQVQSVRIFTGFWVVYILSYVLPSGEITGVPVQKTLLIMLLAVSWFLILKKSGVSSLIRGARLEIITACAGGMWLLAGLFQGNEYGFLFAGLLFINVLTFVTVVYLYRFRMIEEEMLLYALLSLVILKMAGKMVMETAFITGLIDYDGVGQLYLNVFGTEATTMTMDFGSLELVRIQSASDVAVFMLVPFLILMPWIADKIKILLFCLYSIFTLIVFSRLYILMYCCFAVIILWYYRKKISGKIWVLLGGAFLLSAFFWLKPFASMIAFRFFSSFAEESDSIRWTQAGELLEGIREHLWFGSGMGSYLEDYVRNTILPFTYELEYLSFVYQLGIIGFLFIILGIIGIYLKHFLLLYKCNGALILKAVTVLCFLWLWVRPFFNPSFLGLQNGFPLIGMYMIGRYWMTKEGLLVQENYCIMKESQKKG